MHKLYICIFLAPVIAGCVSTPSSLSSGNEQKLLVQYRESNDMEYVQIPADLGDSSSLSSRYQLKDSGDVLISSSTKLDFEISAFNSSSEIYDGPSDLIAEINSDSDDLFRYFGYGSPGGRNYTYRIPITTLEKPSSVGFLGHGTEINLLAYSHQVDETESENAQSTSDDGGNQSKQNEESRERVVRTYFSRSKERQWFTGFSTPLLYGVRLEEDSDLVQVENLGPAVSFGLHRWNTVAVRPTFTLIGALFPSEIEGEEGYVAAAGFGGNIYTTKKDIYVDFAVLWDVNDGTPTVAVGTTLYNWFIGSSD